MFESLLKSMPSILDDLKEGNVKSEYSVDVTTDEGIKKVRDSVYNLKGNIKSLRENLKDSWLSFMWDKDTLNSIDNFSIMKLRFTSSIFFILFILSSIFAAQFAQSMPSIEYTFFILKSSSFLYYDNYKFSFPSKTCSSAFSKISLTWSSSKE